MGSRNEEKPNALKNYGIAERNDLEDTRKLSGHEATGKWARRPLGGANQPHKSGSQGHLLHYDFYRLSNPKKSIFVLQNVKRRAEMKFYDKIMKSILSKSLGVF